MSLVSWQEQNTTYTLLYRSLSLTKSLYSGTTSEDRGSRNALKAHENSISKIHTWHNLSRCCLLCNDINWKLVRNSESHSHPNQLIDWNMCLCSVHPGDLHELLFERKLSYWAKVFHRKHCIKIKEIYRLKERKEISATWITWSLFASQPKQTKNTYICETTENLNTHRPFGNCWFFNSTMYYCTVVLMLSSFRNTDGKSNR